MAQYQVGLDLNRLKQDLNLTDASIDASHFSVEDLQEIYLDYCSRLPTLEGLKNRFISDHIVSAKGVRIHSYNGRVKDPYHLIEKIIRKRSTNYEKYKEMSKDDYYKYITDLIGCRILLVYKSDWEAVHEYLTALFPNDPAQYIDNRCIVSSYDRAEKKPHMAECPVAHIRPGDAEIYPNTKIKLEKDRYYRSLHYIVRFEEYYVEIQVRTLFEEAWGEVDHDVLYPYYKDDPVLVDYSKLINRAAGMCDEMSAYLKDKFVLVRPHRESRLLDVPISTTETSNLGTNPTDLLSPPDKLPVVVPEKLTVQDALKSVIAPGRRKESEA